MRYKVKNNTSHILGTAKTVWISVGTSTNSYPVGPQESALVDDDSYDMIMRNYPDVFTLTEEAEDTAAPVYFKPTMNSAWQLIDLGKYCSKVQIIATAATTVSFTGWAGAPTGNPDAKYQVIVPISSGTPGDTGWEYSNTMNPFRKLYIYGTSGTPTIIGF